MIQIYNIKRLRKAKDRTLWYSLTQKGNSIFQKGQIEMPEGANRNARKGEPIPDINPDINHDIKGTQNGFDRFWAVYPRRVSKEMAVRAWKKLKPDEELIEVIMTDIEHRKEGEWKNQDIRYIPHPATYLNQRRWEDEQTTQEAIQEVYDTIGLQLDFGNDITQDAVTGRNAE